ncbi:MAG: DUF2231 domain-containing protein [Burkholderiaceae bacterium]
MRTELIHPMVVHFPIALIFCMLTIDALAASMSIPVSGRGTVAIVSTSVAVAAGVFALLAFAFGDLAYDIAAEMANVSKQALELHEEAGTVTAFALLGWAVLRLILWWRRIDLGHLGSYAIVAVEVLLALAVVLTAWYGGDLVYEHGIAVVRATG